MSDQLTPANAIADAFDHHWGKFQTFVDDIKSRWPNEVATIEKAMACYASRIHLIRIQTYDFTLASEYPNNQDNILGQQANNVHDIYGYNSEQTCLPSSAEHTSCNQMHFHNEFFTNGLTVDPLQLNKSAQGAEMPRYSNLMEMAPLSNTANTNRNQSSCQSKPRRRLPKHRNQEHGFCKSDYPYLWAEISQRLKKSHHGQISAMCRLYTAIGSEDSISQFRRIQKTMSGSESDVLEGIRDLSIVQTLRRLELVESKGQSLAFQRRILLLRFRKYRIPISRDILKNSKKRNASLEDRWVKSLSLDMMTREAYPDKVKPVGQEGVQAWRKKYSKKRKNIHNRLTSARNWNIAVEKFKLGFLALVPTGGEFHIQNQRFENLREHSCNVLLQVLADKKGDLLTKDAQRFTPWVKAIYDGSLELPCVGTQSHQEISVSDTSCDIMNVDQS